MPIENLGEPLAPPGSIVVDYCRLEGNPEAHLELPHLAIGLQTADNAVPAAVNAGIGIAIYRVVEHIEELRLELCFDLLGDGEVLEDGHVRQELARPSELIAMDVAESRNCRTTERSADSAVGGKGSHRRKVDYLPGLIVEAAGPLVEATG